jgi:hypothetical protein
MKTKTVLITILGLAALAVPAAVPASQPADVRLSQLTPVFDATPAPMYLSTLLADPHAPVALSVVLPADYTELGWIDQDPFAH